MKRDRFAQCRDASVPTARKRNQSGTSGEPSGVRVTFEAASPPRGKSETAITIRNRFTERDIVR